MGLQDKIDAKMASNIAAGFDINKCLDYMVARGCHYCSYWREHEVKIAKEPPAPRSDRPGGFDARKCLCYRLDAGQQCDYCQLWQAHEAELAKAKQEEQAH